MSFAPEVSLLRQYEQGVPLGSPSIHNQRSSYEKHDILRRHFGIQTSAEKLARTAGIHRLRR